MPPKTASGKDAPNKQDMSEATRRLEEQSKIKKSGPEKEKGKKNKKTG